MNFDLNQWYEEKIDEDAIFDYKGRIEDEDVTRILNSIERILKAKDESPKVFKKIFNVLIELVQNLHHHGEVPADLNVDYNKFGVLILRDEGMQYRISVGNFIKIEGLKLIRDRIDQINTLSSEETRNLYRIILNNEQFSEKGGGGLGMVEIARKSGNNMEYQFIDYNTDYLFLSIDVVI
ncbi:SiaB family protein kinase [Marinifilum sp. D737]|uniref:SiaB family protein kinase n=1 Tax=Marinifilum sp. D737 TaxID=2969628 RepID=UPI0022731BA4|nr:SiaB family protein kinase [Marinifilum sp. D737]MCY1634049.1 SiaB family protein kinase [Marinifilum sp. D737]